MLRGDLAAPSAPQLKEFKEDLGNILSHMVSFESLERSRELGAYVSLLTRGSL